MSDDTDTTDADAPDADEILGDKDPEEHRQELMQKAAETKAESEQQHDEMLAAVAEGEDWNVEDYEWVSLGGVKLKVKTWVPGDVMDRMGALSDMAESNDPAVATDAIRANIESLTTQTEVIQSEDATFDTNADIRAFWKNYTDKWGNKGLEKALEAVLEPIEEEQDRKEEAMNSFRANR